MIELMIKALGGLAIFVYGMKMMADGLNIVAGESTYGKVALYAESVIKQK